MDIIKTCFCSLKSDEEGIFEIKCPDNYDMESIIVNQEALYRIAGDRPAAAAYLPPSYGTEKWLDDVVSYYHPCIKKTSPTS